MDARAAVRTWIEGWTRGWQKRDADVIAALYNDGAVFRSHPFRDPELSARDYALRAFADEDLVECRFGEPLIDGAWAAVEYWAILDSGEVDETLAGIALIRFGVDGKVVEQRDYWSMHPGRTPPRF